MMAVKQPDTNSCLGHLAEARRSASEFTPKRTAPAATKYVQTRKKQFLISLVRWFAAQ